jgi:hypothetical protein
MIIQDKRTFVNYKISYDIMFSIQETLFFEKCINLWMETGF